MSEDQTLLNPPTEEVELPKRVLLRGRIISGMPLSVASQKRIVQSFETMLGCHVHLSYRMDKALIAGVRVELNGRAYDGTLHGQLSSARKMLTRHDEEDL